MIDKSQYIFFSNGQKGGTATFLHDHINYLLRKGKNVSLIDDNPKKTYNNLNKKVKKYKINKNRDLLNQTLSKGKNKKFLFITNYAFLIIHYFTLKNFREDNNQIILTIHSGLLTLNIRTYLAGLLFSLLYKNVDFLFFGSSSAKNWWKNMYPWMKVENLPVYHNGIQIKKRKKLNKLGKKVNIAFAARLEKENNPHLFLDIANKVLKKKKNIRFHIFGDGPLLQKLKMKYMNKNIIFYGWVKKNKIFKKSDILMLTGPVNNFPYVALEAKSYGLPVISCSRGDVDKIIKNGIDGFVKHTNEPEILIKLINKVINDYKFFSHNSYLRSFQFEINKACKKLWSKIKIENNNTR